MDIKSLAIAPEQRSTLYDLLDASMKSLSAHHDSPRAQCAKEQSLEDEIAEFARLEMQVEIAVNASMDYAEAHPRLYALGRAFQHKTQWSGVAETLGIKPF